MVWKIRKRKENLPLKKYKWKVEFKNKTVLKGGCTTESLSEVYKIFLTNSFQHTDGGTKGFYYNREEIVYFEVTEITDEEEKINE